MSMKRPNASSNPSSSSSNNKFNSYQHGGGSSTGYQPPVFYAADQTKTLEDATKTYYQVDETAGQVLNQMQAQRQQIMGAHDNTVQMRETTEKAKIEIEQLRKKYRQKKQRLYMYIACLSFIDLLLFLRMLQCHGNFYCLY